MCGSARMLGARHPRHLEMNKTNPTHDVQWLEARGARDVNGNPESIDVLVRLENDLDVGRCNKNQESNE